MLIDPNQVNCKCQSNIELSYSYNIAFRGRCILNLISKMVASADCWIECYRDGCTFKSSPSACQRDQAMNAWHGRESNKTKWASEWNIFPITHFYLYFHLHHYTRYGTNKIGAWANNKAKQLKQEAKQCHCKTLTSSTYQLWKMYINNICEDVPLVA